MKNSIVVIPTYNEVESIGSLLIELKTLPVDILVIDDGSPDGTADLCRSHGVEVLSRSGKLGLGSAYRVGFQIAIDRNYGNIIEMDADGSHQVNDLKKLMEWIGTADLLIGSRWVADGAIKDWSWFRRNLSKGANRFTGLVLSLAVKDSTSGLRIYDAKFLKTLEIETILSEGYCFQIEMVRRVLAHGGSVGEIPITFIERKHGQSKMSVPIATEALLRVCAWGLLRLIGR